MKLQGYLAFGMFGFSMLLAHTAQATCMMRCEDTDAGNDPGYFGVTTMTTSCAAPGGPVSTTRADYFDSCGGGRLVEYACDTAVDGPVRKREYRCASCDPARAGRCLSKVGPALSNLPAEAPSQSCNTVTGGGPIEPICPPQPECPQPPPGCVFEPALDPNGCVIGCGYGCDGSGDGARAMRPKR